MRRVKVQVLLIYSTDWENHIILFIYLVVFPQFFISHLRIRVDEIMTKNSNDTNKLTQKLNNSSSEFGSFVKRFTYNVFVTSIFYHFSKSPLVYFFILFDVIE